MRAIRAVVALLLLIVSQSESGLTQTRDIVVGTVLPLTGPEAAIGVAIRNGLDLRTKEINDTGGVAGRRIDIVVSDGQGRPEQSASAAQRLIAVEHVRSLIAPCCGAAATAIRDAAVPQIPVFLAVAPPSEGNVSSPGYWNALTVTEYRFFDQNSVTSIASPDGSSPVAYRSFFERYRQQYGAAPSNASVLGYNAMSAFAASARLNPDLSPDGLARAFLALPPLQPFDIIEKQPTCPLTGDCRQPDGSCKPCK